MEERRCQDRARIFCAQITSPNCTLSFLALCNFHRLSHSRALYHFLHFVISADFTVAMGLALCHCIRAMEPRSARLEAQDGIHPCWCTRRAPCTTRPPRRGTPRRVAICPRRMATRMLQGTRAKVRPWTRQSAPRCALGRAKACQGAPLRAPKRARVRPWARQSVPRRALAKRTKVYPWARQSAPGCALGRAQARQGAPL